MTKGRSETIASEIPRSLTPEEEDLIMNPSAAYLKKQEEWKLEGKE